MAEVRAAPRDATVRRPGWLSAVHIALRVDRDTYVAACAKDLLDESGLVPVSDVPPGDRCTRRECGLYFP